MILLVPGTLTATPDFAPPNIFKSSSPGNESRSVDTETPAATTFARLLAKPELRAAFSHPRGLRG
jgi:hypothetical protein